MPRNGSIFALLFPYKRFNNYPRNSIDLLHQKLDISLFQEAIVMNLVE